MLGELEESHASSNTLAKQGIGDKIIYENKVLDTPIVWLRIDPDLEFIRKIKSIFIIIINQPSYSSRK